MNSGDPEDNEKMPGTGDTHTDPQKVLDFLARSNLFSSFSDSIQAKLAKIARFERIPPGARIFQQDEKCDFLDAITQGKVGLFVRSDEEETLVAEIPSDKMLGCAEILLDVPHSTDAQAMESTELLRFPTSALAPLLKDIPNISHILSLAALKDTHGHHRDFLAYRHATENGLLDLNRFDEPRTWRLAKAGNEALIQRVVHKISRVLQADRATLFLADPDTGDLYSKVAEGVGAIRLCVPKGTGIAGWVLEHEETLSVEDVYSDERFNPSIDGLVGYKTRSLLCGPIFSPEGQVIGAVQVLNKKQGSFTKADQKLFQYPFTAQPVRARSESAVYT